MADLIQTIRKYLIGQISPLSTTTLTVADGVSTTISVSAEGEITAEMQLRIEDEEVFVSAVTSDGTKEITVVRGCNGTAGVAHSAAQARIINIFCPVFPDDYDPDQPAIAFFRRGGAPDRSTPNLRRPSIQFECYGGSPSAARETYESLHQALQGMASTDVGTQRILWAQEDAGPQDLVSEDGEGKGWHYVLAFFTISVTNI